MKSQPKSPFALHSYPYIRTLTRGDAFTCYHFAILNYKRFEEVNDLLLRAKVWVFYPIKYQIQGFQNRRFHWPPGFLADTFGMNEEYGVEQLLASSQAHPTYKTKNKNFQFRHLQFSVENCFENKNKNWRSKPLKYMYLQLCFAKENSHHNPLIVTTHLKTLRT